MTTLSLARPGAHRHGLARPTPAREDLGGEVTLDGLLTGVWVQLAAHRVVACPVCQSEMAPEYGVHALPIGGRCRGCGAELG